MKFRSENLDSLRKLYDNEIAHLHYVEQQITEALPKMMEKTSDPELKRAFETHLEETRGHLRRLEEVMHESTGKVESKKTKGISGLISEGEDMMTDANEGDVRDAAIIAAAQKIEHYEIAAYGTVRKFAEILEKRDQAALLQQTLDEEKRADAVLTQIADSDNYKAEKAA